MSRVVQLTLYGRVYCHLCDDMELALQALLDDLGGAWVFDLEVVDVDLDDALEIQFGERVPVLCAGARELCHYFLDASAVRAYLAEIH